MRSHSVKVMFFFKNLCSRKGFLTANLFLWTTILPFPRSEGPADPQTGSSSKQPIKNILFTGLLSLAFSLFNYTKRFPKRPCHDWKINRCRNFPISFKATLVQHRGFLRLASCLFATIPLQGNFRIFCKIFTLYWILLTGCAILTLDHSEIEFP